MDRARRWSAKATRRPRAGGTKASWGIQQDSEAGWSSISGILMKHTVNAYDFGVLFDTPIAFPVSSSRLNGFTGRINFIQHRLQRVCGHGAHERDLFAARNRRRPPETLSSATSGSITIRSSMRRRISNIRSARRSAPGRRSLGDTTRSGGRLGAGLRDRADTVARSAGRRWAVLRQHVCDTRCADYRLFVAELRRHRLVIPGTPANPAAADDVANPPRIVHATSLIWVSAWTICFTGARLRQSCASAWSI